MAGDGELPEISPEALARAESALAGLSGRYLDWATADSVRLRACLDEAQAPGADLAALLPRLFTISHDMKGQATTFGYPLVSELGNRLCRLIEEAGPAPAPEILARAARLADGMAQVIAERLEGDGGERGRILLDNC
ncbi:putative Chemotaxis protein histidine kinase and related kinases（contain Signal transduction histidine kinase, phosphotransfer (Hpt) domain&|uniref:peptide ABC transporter substrate-binding protein n=1 Tax=Magnetospirillum sp. XM-1 TaxID=1663591 RepID=UPI00073DE0F0|nr:peptide ABC transporter substrate-binding protein [Magnetospirillum sp. XM-1]CUW37183.1 putative Chemotaxis protein histidine kinase and related kinases\